MQTNPPVSPNSNPFGQRQMNRTTPNYVPDYTTQPRSNMVNIQDDYLSPDFNNNFPTSNTPGTRSNQMNSDINFSPFNRQIENEDTFPSNMQNNNRNNMQMFPSIPNYNQSNVQTSPNMQFNNENNTGMLPCMPNNQNDMQMTPGMPYNNQNDMRMTPNTSGQINRNPNMQINRAPQNNMQNRQLQDPNASFPVIPPSSAMNNNMQDFNMPLNGFSNYEGIYVPTQTNQTTRNLLRGNPYYTPIGTQLYPYYCENSNDVEKDLIYLRQLYPQEVRAILNQVTDSLDQLEYEGSVIFDEYPDRVYLSRTVDRIYEMLLNSGAIIGEPLPNNGQTPCYRTIIEIIFYHEMFDRRRRYRNRNRWF